jgi:hypothetical protein
MMTSFGSASSRTSSRALNLWAAGTLRVPEPRQVWKTQSLWWTSRLQFLLCMLVCSAPAACRLPPAACRLPPAACRLPPAACRLPPAACRLPPAACRLPPAACRMPHAACRMPHAACTRLVFAYAHCWVFCVVDRASVTWYCSCCPLMAQHLVLGSQCLLLRDNPQPCNRRCRICQCADQCFEWT